MKFVIVIILASICLLSLRFFFFYKSAVPLTTGERVFLRVTLFEEPELSNRGQRFMVKNDQNQRIYISSNLKVLYHYGDKLAINGKLQVSKNEKGIVFYSLIYPDISRLPPSTNPLTQASLFVRERSSRLFRETLPDVSASLLLGIVFGAKEDFPEEFFQKLKTTGVLHVIAASGMNVSFFTGALLFSLGVFLPRRISLSLSIFGVIFYSFLVGFESSILRASIMAIIALSASFFGRQSLALFSLFVTGYLMLFVQPNYLQDVGFQLSFMATLGILAIKPVLENVGKFALLEGIREDLLTTLSAQLATFPILLGTFGTIGSLSLLVNMLVLWTVPILMLLGSLAVLVGLVIPVLGKIFLFASLPFLIFFEKVIDLFGAMGLALQVDKWPWEWSVGYYLVLISVLLIYHNKLKVKQS